ncbi:MAG: hypothetical protein WKF59_06720 [Chitinophagaceae bacterium]
MKTRTQLLQKFPEQKPYMFYQAPYVKLTFGNFVTKQEAELYKKQISRMLGGISIYTLSQRIELKPEKEPKEEGIIKSLINLIIKKRVSFSETLFYF